MLSNPAGLNKIILASNNMLGHARIYVCVCVCVCVCILCEHLRQDVDGRGRMGTHVLDALSASKTYMHVLDALYAFMLSLVG
jgi:hypothetical protein